MCFILICKPFLIKLVLITVCVVYLNWNLGSRRVWRSTGCAYSTSTPDSTVGVYKGPLKPVLFTMDSFIYLNWTLILITDFFPFTWLGVLILRTDCSIFLIWTHEIWLLIFFPFEMGHTAGATCQHGCLLLLSTWSHLSYIQRSVFAPFSNLYFWDWSLFVIYIYISHIYPFIPWISLIG
jgi:hypothetical protein